MDYEHCGVSMFLESERGDQTTECLKLRSRWDTGIPYWYYMGMGS